MSDQVQQEIVNYLYSEIIRLKSSMGFSNKDVVIIKVKYNTDLIEFDPNIWEKVSNKLGTSIIVLPTLGRAYDEISMVGFELTDIRIKIESI